MKNAAILWDLVSKEALYSTVVQVRNSGGSATVASPRLAPMTELASAPGPQN